MNHDGAFIPLDELPSMIAALLMRAHFPLPPDAHLRVRYLRRKAGRGCTVVYAVEGNVGPVAGRWITLILTEEALGAASALLDPIRVRTLSLEVPVPGLIRAPECGMTVQAFPADAGLPRLGASCNVTLGSALWGELEEVARDQLQDVGWLLTAVTAEPVRYKPANRCVLRYRLTLTHRDPGNLTQRQMTVYGKLYSDLEQARSVHRIMEQLWDEQKDGTAARVPSFPLLPRPLRLVDNLGLSLSTAVVAGDHDAPAAMGVRVLGPRVKRDGGSVRVTVPGEALRDTAISLARLHTSAVPAGNLALRTGAKEAKRTRERGTVLALHAPEQAEIIQCLAADLAIRLETLEPDSYRPAHGGFKPSQLLFAETQVYVVDFDGFCLADPALDVGYFLAYLRPSGLWYHRPDMRRWFDAAGSFFTASYRLAMIERGVAPSVADGIVERSRLYEATLLFKIAARRANRRQSPRVREVAAMMSEVARCLSRAEIGVEL